MSLIREEWEKIMAERQAIEDDIDGGVELAHETEVYPRKYATPDVTPAQVVALVTAVASVAGIFGIDMSEAQRGALTQLATAVIIILPIVDAVIRWARNHRAAEEIRNTFILKDAVESD